MSVSLRFAAAALAVVAIACGSDGDTGGALTPATGEDSASIEAVIRENFTAVAAGDFDAIYEHSTEASLREAYPDAGERTREGYRAAFEAIAAKRSGVRQPLHAVHGILTEGDRASAVVETWLEYEGSDPASQMIAAGRWRFAREDGRWKIDGGFDWVSPRVPEGAAVIEVEAAEFAWSLDRGAIADGNMALSVRNAGEQVHQLTLQRVPADLDIAGWIGGTVEAPRDGFSEVGASVPLEPGESREVTFTAPLAAGRYVMLCFIEDTADAVPRLHAEKGMWAEFTVP
jgi:ketosteroid isomerase-like protein